MRPKILHGIYTAWLDAAREFASGERGYLDFIETTLQTRWDLIGEARRKEPLTVVAQRQRRQFIERISGPNLIGIVAGLNAARSAVNMLTSERVKESRGFTVGTPHGIRLVENVLLSDPHHRKMVQDYIENLLSICTERRMMKQMRGISVTRMEKRTHAIRRERHLLRGAEA